MRSKELWAILSGVALLALYARYLSTHEIKIVFWLFSNLAYISEGELLLWLAHSIFVVPASLLIGWGLTSWLSRTVRKGADKVSSNDRAFRISALCFFVGLFLIYSVLAVGVMLGLPITDDEIAVQFAAKIWQEGHFTMPLLEPQGAYSDLFTYSRDGQITSFDWPGTIATQAAAQASGLGQMLYALLAALGGLATAACANRWLGRRAAILAAALWLLSPMGLTLSLTTHAHVLSRTCIALSFYWVSVLHTQESDARPLGPALALGACIGIGTLSRPFETGFILAPLLLWLAYQCLRDSPNPRKTLVGVICGIVPFIALHLLYNLAITGNAFLPPRFDSEHISAGPLPVFSAFDRVGNHMAHNVMMLAVFALGPLAAFGAFLAAFTSDKRVPVGLLGAGVVSVLVLTLAHDNIGIHSVGPIHYSEAFVPILLLFVFFLVSIAEKIPSPLWRRRLVAGVASYIAIALTLSSFQQLKALGNQADVTNLPLVALQRQNIHNAIIVAPPRPMMYSDDSAGSWVLDFPPAHPSDDIIFVRPQANLQEVLKIHPQRSFWKLIRDPELRQFRLIPIEK